MATSVNIEHRDDVDDKPTDLESLLAEWEPYTHQVYLRAARHGADGKIPVVGTMNFDATMHDVKRAWGGGKYRFMAIAREPFTRNGKNYGRGSIVGQVTVEMEGEPITRLAGTLADALREADESPRGAPPATPAPMQLPANMSGDLGILTLAFQSMMENNRVTAERATAQQAESRDLFLAMLNAQKRDVDPWEMIDRILDVRGKLGGDDVSIGAALMASLPQLGGAVEKILAKLPDRPAPAAGQPKQQQPPPHKLRIAGDDEPKPAGGYDRYAPEQRLMLALQTLAAGVTDSDFDAAAMASVIGSLVGSEIAQSMADEPTTVRQVIEYAPHLADYVDRVEAVHRELARMFEPDDDGGGDDEPTGTAA